MKINSKKNTKNIKNTKNKIKTKSKKNKTGGAAAMINQQKKKIMGNDNDRCDLSKPYLNDVEKAFFSPNKLFNKIDNSDLLTKEKEEFKKIFKINMRGFCSDTKSNQYLKFCSNLFNCIKEPKLFYEVLNDIFDLEIKDAPKLKDLYKRKKQITKDLTLEDFYKQETKERARSISLFLIKVLFKTINQYEAKHPPEKINPTHTILLKSRFEILFSDIKILIDFKNETTENLTKKILDKKDIIQDYYTNKLFSSDLEESDRANKEHDGGASFILIIVGGFLSMALLNTNMFNAPPQISGSIT